MHISKVADIIHTIATGIEEECARCLSDNSKVVVMGITEQLYSGLSGNDKYLSPTYDDDPFFNEEGTWKGRASDYKAWKRAITPPAVGPMLGLDGRPDNVPNLFINGKFYSQIYARREGMMLVTDVSGGGAGGDILNKYGEDILTLGTAAKTYFIKEYLLKSIESFYEKCGYV